MLGTRRGPVVGESRRQDPVRRWGSAAVGVGLTTSHPVAATRRPGKVCGRAFVISRGSKLGGWSTGKRRCEPTETVGIEYAASKIEKASVSLESP